MAKRRELQKQKTTEDIFLINQSYKGKLGGKSNAKSGNLLIAASKSGKLAVETGRIKEVSSAGGKVSGKNNVESGHLAKIAPAAQRKAQEPIACKHCGKVMNRINHGKYHGDKCKLKP
jgi:phage FluMu protein Com